MNDNKEITATTTAMPTNVAQYNLRKKKFLKIVIRGRSIKSDDIDHFIRCYMERTTSSSTREKKGTIKYGWKSNWKGIFRNKFYFVLKQTHTHTNRLNVSEANAKKGDSKSGQAKTFYVTILLEFYWNALENDIFCNNYIN